MLGSLQAILKTLDNKATHSIKVSVVYLYVIQKIP